MSDTSIDGSLDLPESLCIMLRTLDTFPLAPSIRSQLNRLGFRFARDVLELTPLALAKELNVDREEALEVLKVIRCAGDEALAKGPNSGPRAPTAKELLEIERSRAPITTFSANLDSLLGGSSPYTAVQKGVARGCVTEFCGAPGIGKTQLGMQVAVSVQIPAVLGGAEGEAVYIDTEGSFIIERVTQMAQAAVQQIQDMAEAYQDPIELEAARALSVEAILHGIYYFRVHSFIEQIALVRQLSKFVAEHPKVKLVVIDSIAFHFRGGHTDMPQRTRLLHLISQQLAALANSEGLAVVLTNQMTTKIKAGVEAKLVPALGESWGHASTHRVVLYWEKGQRLAHMYKSSCTEEGMAPYDVTADGIRDPPQSGHVQPYDWDCNMTQPDPADAEDYLAADPEQLAHDTADYYNDASNVALDADHSLAEAGHRQPSGQLTDQYAGAVDDDYPYADPAVASQQRPMHGGEGYDMGGPTNPRERKAKRAKTSAPDEEGY